MSNISATLRSADVIAGHSCAAGVLFAAACFFKFSYVPPYFAFHMKRGLLQDGPLGVCKGCPTFTPSRGKFRAGISDVVEVNDGDDDEPCTPITRPLPLWSIFRKFGSLANGAVRRLIPTSNKTPNKKTPPRAPTPASPLPGMVFIGRRGWEGWFIGGED